MAITFQKVVEVILSGITSFSHAESKFHVNGTVEDLRSRLISVPFASTILIDEKVLADYVARQLVKNHWNEVQAWGIGQERTISFKLPIPDGAECIKISNTCETYKCTRLIVVLVKTPLNGFPFRVLTIYPI